MNFDFYYGKQADQFSYIRIPKAMMINNEFSVLSLPAKVLYGLLLDRMSLSMKNEWLDKENKVYIIYQISEIQEDLGYSKKKAMEYLNELESFGLVEKKKRGFGLPSILYVKNFIIDEETEKKDIIGTSRSDEIGTSVENNNDNNKPRKDTIYDEIGEKMVCLGQIEGENDRNEKYRGVEKVTSRSAQMGTSRGPHRETTEVTTGEPLKSNTEYNNHNNKSNQILSSLDENGTDMMDEYLAYKELVMENIEYDCLLDRYKYDQERIDEILELISETLICKQKEIIIASNTYPTELVKSKFTKLDMSHIEYVLECLNSNTTQIKNYKKYILASLFNAPNTIKGYYQAEVNHDLPQFAGKIKTRLAN